MTDVQRWLVYTRFAQLTAGIEQHFNLSVKDALDQLMKSNFAAKLESINTGYYLESDAYLLNEYLETTDSE